MQSSMVREIVEASEKQCEFGFCSDFNAKRGFAGPACVETEVRFAGLRGD